ncbi:hypothetical protein CC78DRAFT_586850 [Lojkania enalia]|uniref:Uncharacterized protein n=1 Tax=Lojkania enalia TaxID=147567 RepID=A0A9P4JZH0_9PLEO|nr:hypothetical protein CC78DRAFT_586850 [Didymosphaeria enalia]
MPLDFIYVVTAMKGQMLKHHTDRNHGILQYFPELVPDSYALHEHRVLDDNNFRQRLIYNVHIFLGLINSCMALYKTGVRVRAEELITWYYEASKEKASPQKVYTFKKHECWKHMVEITYAFKSLMELAEPSLNKVVERWVVGEMAVDAQVQSSPFRGRLELGV